MVDGDLNSYLKTKSYGHETRSRIRAVFDVLSLPMPQTGEFYKTEDMGALVLLSPYACSLRITSVSFPTYNDPAILQPLLRFGGKNLHVELFPGVATPYTSRDYSQWFGVFKTLETRLLARGLQIIDINANNGGRLPAPYDKHHVLIDPGAVKRLAHGVRYADAALPCDDPQVVLFGTLKSRFNAAVEARSHTLINQAWQCCKQAKTQGTLVANWEHNDYRGTQKAAEKYSARLPALQ